MPLKHSRSTVTANKAHPHKDNERGMERFAGRICSNFWVERNGEVVLVNGGWHCWRLWLRPVDQCRCGTARRPFPRGLAEVAGDGGSSWGQTHGAHDRRAAWRRDAVDSRGRRCVRRFRRFTAGLQDMIERRFAEAFEES